MSLEAMVEAYLMGRITRQEALEQLGPEMLEEIAYQRDALKRDVVWGAQQAADDDGVGVRAGIPG